MVQLALAVKNDWVLEAIVKNKMFFMLVREKKKQGYSVDTN